VFWLFIVFFFVKRIPEQYRGSGVRLQYVGAVARAGTSPRPYPIWHSSLPGYAGVVRRDAGNLREAGKVGRKLNIERKNDKDDPHLEAWRRFNKTIGSDGSVGIFHETFLVDAGKYEALYGNMPVFGLAAATKHVPAVGKRETARRRLGGESEPAVAAPMQPVS
jgi:Monooxygenase af470-like